jgi:hypothetical protein
MGDGDHFTKLVMEQRMIHQFAAIFSCSIHDLISRGGIFPEVSFISYIFVNLMLIEPVELFICL